MRMKRMDQMRKRKRCLRSVPVCDMSNVIPIHSIESRKKTAAIHISSSSWIENFGFSILFFEGE
jgi:hypothetical protein